MSGGLRLAPSSASWVEAACANLPLLLLDHAHCERKAAATVLALAARQAGGSAAAHQMSRMAREELLHFERLLTELERRRLAYRPLTSSGYAAALFDRVRAHPPAERRACELIACALIEARSHERFGLLERAVDDAGLRALYAELASAEARHADAYLDWAAEDAGANLARLVDELTALEAALVARREQPIRMHAGG